MTRIGVLVVAYNAAGTLSSVLDRIPADFRGQIHEILVNDDASADETHLVALGYKELSELPITVQRQPKNLGYGGNQKSGYQYAIDHGWDHVVLLHGDGQYAPECLPRIVAPLVDGDADAVFGSRMMTRGAARAGGMPLYKFVGNKILTRYQNAMTGAHLSEWHSGYRAYSVRALSEIAFQQNSDDFDFDTEIILQFIEQGRRIAEVPIPTYYGDEICYVNGLGYARDVVVDVAKWRLHRMGFGGTADTTDTPYELKASPDTSHGRILEWMRAKPPSRVLDLGCSDGRLGNEFRRAGHTVTGVDIEAHKGVHENLDAFVQANLDTGLPAEVGDGYDIVVAADVLEHVREPEVLLNEVGERLAPGGVIITSVPNISHWYPRTRIALGRFDYDRRGILDRGHVRFFTRNSFEKMVRGAGYRVRRRRTVGVPLEAMDRGKAAATGTSRVRHAAAVVDQAGVSVWPTMFGFQFVYELEPISGSTPGTATSS